MKIIYGVSGEGLGHVFEAIEVVKFLEQEGHTVKVLAYGDRARETLKEFHPTRIEGVLLHFNKKGLSVGGTAFKNFRVLPFYIKNWRKLKKEFKAFEPDVFITAYEPFTTLVAYLFKKPLISMDNQNEILQLKRPREIGLYDFKVTTWSTRVASHHATYYIIKSLKKPAIEKKNIYFVSPIIQNDIKKLKPEDGDHVLVYLTTPNPAFIEILKSVPERFIVYCKGKTGEDGNVTYRAQGPTYLHDLSTCKAIIGTTGFSLIADSIYLKKPYFGLPLKKQFEQIHNAHFLRESGIGEFSENVTRAELEHFLSHLEKYKSRLESYDLDPDEQKQTLKMLLEKL